MLIDDWIKSIDKFFGFNQFHHKPGRPYKRINEDLIVLMHLEGCSNREISRQTGIDRRTIDRRILKLIREEKIK